MAILCYSVLNKNIRCCHYCNVNNLIIKICYFLEELFETQVFLIINLWKANPVLCFSPLID